MNYFAQEGTDVILKNAKLFNDRFEVIRADVETAGEKIARIGPELTGAEHSINLSGCLILPGLVDIHIHGCAGADTFDGTRDSIARMAAHLVQKGVTSFCPTTMTGSYEQIAAALFAVRDCMEHPPQGAAVLGAHMEGPYLSAGKKGAQRGDALRSPDFAEFLRLYHGCGGAIRLVDVAPECENAREFITRASEFCTVSAAHSEADYDTAMQSFRWGITHATHLFNAMTGLHHRQPGMVGAVFDAPDVRAELICDGLHVHPAVLRIAFRLLGEERSVVVSDSMRAAGLPDGESELGGQTVFLKNGAARLADGTLAGSTTNLLDEIRNLVRFGVPLRQAVRSATINPAAAIGRDGEIGSIREGKRADFTVLDEELRLRLVVVRGAIAYEAPPSGAVSAGGAVTPQTQ